jgi:hypothetical protein
MEISQNEQVTPYRTDSSEMVPESVSLFSPNNREGTTTAAALTITTLTHYSFALFSSQTAKKNPNVMYNFYCEDDYETTLGKSKRNLSLMMTVFFFLIDNVASDSEDAQLTPKYDAGTNNKQWKPQTNKQTNIVSALFFRA